MSIINWILSSKEKRWYILNITSFLILIIYILYNCFLGLKYHLVWNISICMYYVLLLIIKAIIVINEVNIKNKETSIVAKKRKSVFYTTSILLFVINIALIAPIVLMALNKKSVELDIIAGIAVATYTTYKVIIAILNYVKNRQNENLAFRQLRTINLVDAILSILTLQNTLISIAGSGEYDSMFPLVVLSSCAGVIIMLILSIVPLVRVMRENKNK